jgi:hypothetical protein
MAYPTDAMHKQARAQTDPLFFQDYFMAHGHDVSTKNATATYVQFEGRLFAVTCRHVVELLEKRKQGQHSPYPTLALVVDGGLLNLSFFTAEGLQTAMNLRKVATGEELLDLAITELPTSYWEILTSRKKKRPCRGRAPPSSAPTGRLDADRTAD